MNGKLVPAFGNIELKDITTEILQSYVADLLAGGLSAKYVRNILSTMSAMWDVAVSWKYVNHKPFAELILPECECSEVELYSQEEVITIFRSAREPFRTFLWILGETGMRPGEVCALDAKHVHVHDRVISVRQNESLGSIVSPKTHAGYRDFAISAQLAEHLKVFIGAREIGLLFVSKSGRAWRESKVVEKKLNPLLRQLAIKPRGLHSIRHFQRNTDGSRAYTHQNPPESLRSCGPQDAPGHAKQGWLYSRNRRRRSSGSSDVRRYVLSGFVSRCVQERQRSGTGKAKQAVEFKGLQGLRENPLVRVEKFKSSLPDQFFSRLFNCLRSFLGFVC